MKQKKSDGSGQNSPTAKVNSQLPVVSQASERAVFDATRHMPMARTRDDQGLPWTELGNQNTLDEFIAEIQIELPRKLSKMTLDEIRVKLAHDERELAAIRAECGTIGDASIR